MFIRLGGHEEPLTQRSRHAFGNRSGLTVVHADGGHDDDADAKALVLSLE